jgi:cysteinyl-tRNA synthetase
MIEFARVLEDKGYAYKLPAGLYFDTARVRAYGKLALLDLAGLQEGARVAPTPGKRNASDFALVARLADRRDAVDGVGIPVGAGSARVAS